MKIKFNYRLNYSHFSMHEIDDSQADKNLVLINSILAIKHGFDFKEGSHIVGQSLFHSNFPVNQKIKNY